MALIQYQLKPAYIGSFTGGVIYVDNARSLDIQAALTAGSGTISADENDAALIAALDGYLALRRVGTTADAAPATQQITRRTFRGHSGARQGRKRETGRQGLQDFATSECWGHG